MITRNKFVHLSAITLCSTLSACAQRNPKDDLTDEFRTNRVMFEEIEVFVRENSINTVNDNKLAEFNKKLDGKGFRLTQFGTGYIEFERLGKPLDNYVFFVKSKTRQEIFSRRAAVETIYIEFGEGWYCIVY